MNFFRELAMGLGFLQNNEATSSLTEHVCHTKFVIERCTISWNIANFSFCRNAGYFESPCFPSENGKGMSQWKLRMKLDSNRDIKKLSVYLNLVTRRNEPIFGKYKISFQSYQKVLLEQPLKEGTFCNEGLLIFESDDNCAFLWNLRDDKITVTVEVYATIDTVVWHTALKDTERIEGKMCEKIHDLFLKKAFTDITICVQRKEIQAHKLILSAGSPVFEAMLKDQNVNKIVIRDFDFGTINQLIYFIYSQKTPYFKSFKSCAILSILEASRKYEVNDLTRLVVDYLIRNLDENNVIDVLILADLHTLYQLKEKAIHFLCANKIGLASHERYPELKKLPHLLSEIVEKML